MKYRVSQYQLADQVPSYKKSPPLRYYDEEKDINIVVLQLTIQK